MSYAIANVIYGVPLTRDEILEKVSIDDLDGQDGFLSYYSGGADVQPMAFGVALSEFDEATDYVDMRTLQIMPTGADLDQYQRCLDQLEDPEKSILAAEKPFVFILWSTS